MYRKVRSIPCGKIFELHKATVLSKFLVLYDSLPITIKRRPEQQFEIPSFIRDTYYHMFDSLLDFR